jgi:hypothetical protein
MSYNPITKTAAQSLRQFLTSPAGIALYTVIPVLIIVLVYVFIYRTDTLQQFDIRPNTTPPHTPIPLIAIPPRRQPHPQPPPNTYQQGMRNPIPGPNESFWFY